MAVVIDLDPINRFFDAPDSYAEIASNPGFDLYWRHQGQDASQVASDMASSEAADQIRNLEQMGMLSTLRRIAGTSIQQQVTRHLPPGSTVEARIVFVPGHHSPLFTQNNIVAINVFALEKRLTKLFISDYPLLSLLANRVHRLCAQALAFGSGQAVDNLMTQLLLQGSATLFFTRPVTGNLADQWKSAEGQREAHINLLRRYLQAPAENGAALEHTLGLSGPSALAAQYPVGTWMCQVIESALGRAGLVELLHNPAHFVPAFERARRQFGLPQKYSLEVEA